MTNVYRRSIALIALCFLIPVVMGTTNASQAERFESIHAMPHTTSPTPFLTTQTARDVQKLAALEASHPGDGVIRGPDQLIYNIDVTIDPFHHTFSGRLSLHLHNNTPIALTQLYFNVWPDAPHYAQKGSIESVQNAKFDGKNVMVSQKGTVLTMDLQSPLDKGQRGVATFEFHAKLPEINDRYGWEGTTMNFGNWFPILAVYDQYGWVTPPYFPDGESFYSLTAAFHLNVTVPHNEVIATSGDCVATSHHADGTVTYRSDSIGSRDVAMVADSQYKSIQRTIGNTTVTTYYTKSEASQADLMETVGVNSLQYYEQHYGHYPFSSLRICAMHGWFGGMEYPGLVMISFNPNGNSELETTTDVAHEVAHQWFYSLLGDDEYVTPWVDESFATFSEMRFDRHLSSLTGQLPTSQHVSFPVSAFGNSDLTGADPNYFDSVYLGGALMLKDLLTRLGPMEFDDMMKAYFNHYEYNVATTADFMNFASSYTGSNLTAFFHSHGIYAEDAENSPEKPWARSEEAQNGRNWS